MEGSNRTNARINHLCSSTKNKIKQNKKGKKKEKKNIQPYDRMFVVKQNINHFKFIMTPTRGKNLWHLRRRYGTMTLPSRKPRTVVNMLL